MTTVNEKIQTIAHVNSLVDEAISSTAKDDNNIMKVPSIETTIEKAREEFVYSLEEERLLKKINYTTIPFIFIVVFLQVPLSLLFLCKISVFKKKTTLVNYFDFEHFAYDLMH